MGENQCNLNCGGGFSKRMRGGRANAAESGPNPPSPISGLYFLHNIYYRLNSYGVGSRPNGFVALWPLFLLRRTGCVRTRPQDQVSGQMRASRNLARTVWLIRSQRSPRKGNASCMVELKTSFS